MTAVCSAVVALLAAPAAATVESVPRTDDTLTIDGIMDEAAWRDAMRVDLAMETEPGENTEAPVATTVYLLEDGDNLYLAFDAQDPHPAAIRAYLRDRDSAYSDDIVGVALDTYNDERRAFQFFANPLGVQIDMTKDDVNNFEDDAWDAIWTSAGRIDERGYVVEMQIPLSQLRFPNNGGRQTWGYDLLRFYPRDHRYRLSNNRIDRDRNCYLCQMSKMSGFEGARLRRDLEVVPTLTASRAQSTDAPGVEPLSSEGSQTDVGITVRWGITPDMTANLAINPDFSQVEADVAQLDVNERFALFFPETRPFFLEGADYFSTPVDAVFTRTVADPVYGAKLTGKRDANTYGVFAAEDDVTNLLFPGAFGSDSTTLEQSNSSIVARYSRGFGDASAIGALLTVREGNGYHNRVGGLDGRWKISDKHSLWYQYLRSDTEYPADTALEFGQPGGSFDGTAATLRYEFESRDWFANVSHRDLSDGFRADAGFISQVGIDETEVTAGRVWHGDADDWWYRIRGSLNYEIAHDELGRVLERENTFRLGVGAPLQTWLQLAWVRKTELYEDTSYDLDVLRLFAEITPRRGLEIGMLVRLGDQIDFANNRLGKRRQFDPFLNWNVNRNLLLRLQGVMLHLETASGETVFDAALADLRLTWQFNLRSFLRLTVQLQDVERNQAVHVDAVDARTKESGRQLLYSYKLNPRTVFFLGYSDQYVDDDSLSGPTVSDRSWFMKIGYAWTP